MAAIASLEYAQYETRRRDPDPAVAALLVIDVQEHFASISSPILPSLRSTIALCRSKGIPIIFTRHIHKSPADHAMLGEWWPGDLIIAGSHSADLIPAIGRLSGDRIVEKSTYSAFYGTDLEDLLRMMDVKELIVTGVMTNLCCETTAREAFVRGFRVFFSTDATATSSKELHVATLKNMAYGFSYLVDCGRLEEAFQG